MRFLKKNKEDDRILETEDCLNTYFELLIFENNEDEGELSKFIEAVKFQEYPKDEEIMFWLKKISMVKPSICGYSACVDKCFEIKRRYE